jgi:hypothetical protein
VLGCVARVSGGTRWCEIAGANVGHGQLRATAVNRAVVDSAGWIPCGREIERAEMVSGSLKGAALRLTPIGRCRKFNGWMLCGGL